jgi:hypothetical protein
MKEDDSAMKKAWNGMRCVAALEPMLSHRVDVDV